MYTLRGLVCYSLDFPSHNYLCKYIYIDVLKTDIDGSEWTALTCSVEAGELRTVRQLLVAICANPNYDYNNGIEKLKVLSSLEKRGFRIYLVFKNLRCSLWGVFSCISFAQL